MAEDQTNPQPVPMIAEDGGGATVTLPAAVSETTIGLAVTAEGDVTAMASAPPEHTPTPEEARAMFDENPGLWAVLTTEGNKLRGEC